MEIYGKQVKHTFTQVPLVCCPVPSCLFPAVPVHCVCSIYGRLEGDDWDWCTGHYTDYMCIHYKHPPKTDAHIFATKTTKLGLSSYLDDLIAAHG